MGAAHMTGKETDPLIASFAGDKYNEVELEDDEEAADERELKEAAQAQRDPEEHAQKQRHLLVSMGLTLPYLGLVTALLCANNYDQDTVIEAHYFYPFHMYEFWGGVYFSLVEAYILLVADDSFKVMDSTGQSVLVHLLSLNIVSTMVAASLFTLDPEIFEVLSHYIEYASQVTVTMLDAFFMILPRNGARSLVGSKRGRSMGIPIQFQTAYFIFLLLMDFGKFLLYAKVIPTEIGHERSSHYVEFIGEILNSLWAFWYIKDLYMQSL